MRKLITILLLIPCLCNAQYAPFLVQPAPRPLFFTFGDSISDGYALNSDADGDEVGERTTAKILNNTTLSSFDNLWISTIGDGFSNTHVGHLGSASWGAVHGWQLQLANRASDLGGIVYLVGGGQGGSTSTDWDNDSYTNGSTVAPYTLLTSRLDAAISLYESINSATPQLVGLMSLGTNDAIGSVPAATFKTKAKSVIQKLQTDYPGVIIIMRKVLNSYTGYNDKIEEICSELSNCYFIETSDETTRDGIHPDYAGNILEVNRFLNVYLGL